MKRRALEKYGAFLIYGIALVLCAFSFAGCISGRSWQTFKAHGQEVGIATAGGALAVATGGVAGVACAVAGMAAGAFVGEMDKPEPKEVHTTTVLDKEGHILSQKTTQSAPVAATQGVLSMFADFSWTAVKWILLFMGLNILFKYAFGERYRVLVHEFLVNLMLALKNIATLNATAAVGNIAAASKAAHQASGMGHSRP